MARKSRSTNRNNIVIVCEGTDTEVKYLTDLKGYIECNYPDRFSEIRVVPTSQELVVATNRGHNRKLKGVAPLAYYVQEEDNQSDFDKYKSQPTRYVREAELFIINDGYSEAWAVYDHDNFPDHKFAYSHAAAANVKIAFSSISFEQWILAHFERNGQPFAKSVCKENKRDIMCGTNVHKDDCHGTKCVAGHIRELKYIPDYGKSMEGLFHLLFDKHNVAMVNAAWTRSLHPVAADIWDCNPVTTVDRLVSHLLGNMEDYLWIKDPGDFAFDRTRLCLDGHRITNMGNTPVAVGYKIYDSGMTVIDEGNTGVIFPGDGISLSISSKGKLIGLNDRKYIQIAEI